MFDIEEIIKRLKARPGMYLGKKNEDVKEIYIFLNGFYTGKISNDAITAIDVSFDSNFSHYMFDWLNKNNKLNDAEFSFQWHLVLDSFENGISLFYLICEDFFSDYHSDKLCPEKYYYTEGEIKDILNIGKNNELPD